MRFTTTGYNIQNSKLHRAHVDGVVGVDGVDGVVGVDWLVGVVGFGWDGWDKTVRIRTVFGGDTSKETEKPLLKPQETGRYGATVPQFCPVPRSLDGMDGVDGVDEVDGMDGVVGVAHTFYVALF